MEVRRLNGSCLCGAVRYTVADEFLYASITAGVYSLVRDARFVHVALGTLADELPQHGEFG